MARVAVDQLFGSLATYAYPTGYDAAKLGLGGLMVQKTGGTPSDKWVGPMPVAVARPVEQSTSIPAIFPFALRWSTTEDWVFLADNAAAATTRRIVFYKYNRTTNLFSWEGFITLTYPPATNHTIRGLRMTYDKYTTGTVAVSGTAVTGSGTAWSADRLATGSRIGFGSTDPTLIGTWHEISAIGSDTSITLTASAPTFGAGTPYVIEELRCVTLTTNATAANGGLFVAKGLRIENFSPTGTTIAAATTTDNIRAVFWLADAATVTHTAGAGLGIEPRVSFTDHTIWGLDGTTSIILFKYNLRAALAGLASGKSTSAFIFKTAAQAVTGTASQANNGRYAVASHGPGSGIPCLYFTTTTRLYRTKDVTTIISGDTAWQGDAAVEIPPGGTNTFAASSLINSIEYMDSIDKFVVAVNSTTTPFRDYVTQYRTDSGQWDRIWGVDMRQIDQAVADSSVTPIPNKPAHAWSFWVEAGLCYMAGIGTTALINLLYAIPLAADWEYAATSNQRIVLPKMTTPNVDRFIRVVAGEQRVIGGATGMNLGSATEPFRVYYRTTGISDNSGAWVLLDDSGEFTGSVSAAEIQIMLEFRTIGVLCVPARINSVSVVYQDLTTESHYQPSIGLSDKANKNFAWRHSVAFGGAVPALRVRLFDAVTGGLLVDDNTDTPTGTFERSTNGGSSWSAWTNADKANEQTYIRYTPASLADNIRVRALLTLK